MDWLFFRSPNKNKASEPSQGPDQVSRQGSWFYVENTIYFKCFLIYLTFQEERLHWIHTAFHNSDFVFDYRGGYTCFFQSSNSYTCVTVFCFCSTVFSVPVFMYHHSPYFTYFNDNIIFHCVMPDDPFLDCWFYSINRYYFECQVQCWALKIQ